MLYVSRLFALEEVDFPMVESEELYTRKAGEEIVDQVYNFSTRIRVLYVNGPNNFLFSV